MYVFSMSITLIVTLLIHCHDILVHDLQKMMFSLFYTSVRLMIYKCNLSQRFINILFLMLHNSRFSKPTNIFHAIRQTESTTLLILCFVSGPHGVVLSLPGRNLSHLFNHLLLLLTVDAHSQYGLCLRLDPLNTISLPFSLRIVLLFWILSPLHHVAHGKMKISHANRMLI